MVHLGYLFDEVYHILWSGVVKLDIKKDNINIQVLGNKHYFGYIIILLLFIIVFIIYIYIVALVYMHYHEKNLYI